MKYAVLFTAIVGHAAAQSAYGSSVSSAIVSIYTGIVKLDAAVKSYHGAPAGASSVKTKAQAVLNSIHKADAVVTAGPTITDVGVALALTTPLNSLTADLSAVVTDLISSHKVFVSACQAPVVSSQLAAQFAAANRLAKDIVSHLPAFADGIASSYTYTISSYLKSALNVYKTDSTVPASCKATATTSSTTLKTTTFSTEKAPAATA